MRPQPFRARFVPRNPQIKSVFEWEAAAAVSRLSKYDGETRVPLQDFFARKTVYDENKH